VTTNGVANKAIVTSCDASSLTLFDETGQDTIVMKRVNKRSAVEIVSAIYGSGDKTADVNKKLQELINNGICNVWIGNHILGVDPIKGVQKHLKVVYTVDGVQKEESIVERGYFKVCPK